MMHAFRVSLIGLAATLGLAASAASEPLQTSASERSKSPPNRAEVVECRVSLRQPGLGVEPVFLIVDPKLIEKLVLDPIKRAVHDPEPAEYIVMGSVTLISKDGSRDYYTLFAGWKYFSRGDEHLITDFSELKKGMKQAVDVARWAVGSK